MMLFLLILPGHIQSLLTHTRRKQIKGTTGWCCYFIPGTCSIWFLWRLSSLSIGQVRAVLLIITSLISFPADSCMVVLLLSLHSNEMSLQVVQNVAKLNSWEQTVFSVTVVRWHGLIWEEMPLFSQEGSLLLVFKRYCINGLLNLTSLAFLWRVQ